jgi:hypothetical protein
VTQASNKGLKRKVGVIPLKTKAFLRTRNWRNCFNISFRNHREDLPGHLANKPGDADYPAFLAEPKRLASGSLDNFALAKEAKQFGLNSVIPDR